MSVLIVNKRRVFMAVFALVAGLLSQAAIAAAALVTIKNSKGGVNYYWRNAEDVGVAERKALADCKAKNGKAQSKGCELYFADDGPGYWAIFHAENGKIGVAVSVDRQEAINNAHANCRQVGECPRSANKVWVDSGGNAIREDESDATPGRGGRCWTEPTVEKLPQYGQVCNYNAYGPTVCETKVIGTYDSLGSPRRVCNR